MHGEIYRSVLEGAQCPPRELVTVFAPPPVMLPTFPYLDRAVVEYVQRLGAGLKVRNGSRKWLHRRVSRAFLPARILKRKKRGFAANVVDGWFKSSVSGKLDESLLDSTSAMFELLRP